MLIPLNVPLAQVFGLSTQLCVVAFAFGDGFSNVFYPTNPALLIALGLADVSYGDWFKWSGRFQMFNLILTSLILIFGLWQDINAKIPGCKTGDFLCTPLLCRRYA